MKLEPSDFGNGIYVACIHVHSFEEEEDDYDGEVEGGDEAIVASTEKLSTKKTRKIRYFKNIKISRYI